MNDLVSDNVKSTINFNLLGWVVIKVFEKQYTITKIHDIDF